MLHTRSINILTCISTRLDTQGFVDISPVLDHVLKFNPYVSGLFCTCGVVVIQCFLDISRYLFLINSHKMSRGSPIRTRYGVSLWIHSSCFLFLLFVLCATSGNIRPRYNVVSMVILLPPDHGDHPWVWDMVTSGQLFTVQGGGGGGGVLQRGLVGSRSREMDVMLIVSLWSLTGIPAALPRCQSNFRVIEEI